MAAAQVCPSVLACCIWRVSLIADVESGAPGMIVADLKDCVCRVAMRCVACACCCARESSCAVHSQCFRAMQTAKVARPATDAWKSQTASTTRMARRWPVATMASSVCTRGRAAADGLVRADEDYGDTAKDQLNVFSGRSVWQLPHSALERVVVLLLHMVLSGVPSPKVCNTVLTLLRIDFESLVNCVAVALFSG